MKKNIYYSILSLLILFVTGCELPDNINTKAASSVTADVVFTQAEVAFGNQVDELSMNFNIGRFLAQYASQVQYTNESRYNFQDRSIPNTYWGEFYRDVLMDLKETEKLLTEGEVEAGSRQEKIINNKIGAIRVMEVYSYQCLVDAFGDVPYTEALQGIENAMPAYDDAKTIYVDLIATISDAISMMDTDYEGWGAEDIIYGGDVAGWKKAAASLKLRLAMRLADVDAATSKKAAVEAINAGCIVDNSETFNLHYDGTTPHVNTIYNRINVANRNDYSPSNTIIDYMLGLDDPRLPLYFTKVDTSAGGGEPIYYGLTYGLVGNSNYNKISHFSDQMFDPTFPATFIEAAEVHFLMAEAAERGYGISGTTEDHYNAAIKASVTRWGGSEADADAYIATADVAWSSAPGTWKEKLAMQKWLALYNQGVEGWAEWRRFDHPTLNVPEEMSYSDIPMRYPYPYNEDDLNYENYTAAASAIGGDAASTKIFWDIY